MIYITLLYIKGEKMRKLVSSLVLAGLLTIPGMAAEKVENLMVIVTSDDSLTQLMAGVLALQSKKQGANVELLFCGKAGDLVIKGSKEIKLKPKGMSPQMLITKLISLGSTVEICPPYLPNASKTKADLISGVNIAKPPKVASKILDKNTKILSY
jgi:predicted peroxiredoxin